MGIRQKRSFDHSSIGTSKETCTMDLKVCLVLMFAIAMVAAAPAPVRRGKRRGRGKRFSHRNAEFDRQPLRRYDEVDDERYDGPAWQEFRIWPFRIWPFRIWTFRIWRFRIWQFRTWPFGPWSFRLWPFRIWPFGLWPFGSWQFGLWPFRLWPFGLWPFRTWRCSRLWQEIGLEVLNEFRIGNLEIAVKAIFVWIIPKKKF